MTRMMPTMPNTSWRGRRRGTQLCAAATEATAAALAPDAIEEDARQLRIDDEWARTLGLSAWAGSVPWGWLARLIALRERLILSLHLAPQDTTHAVAELSDVLVGLESVSLFAQGRGHLPSEGRRQAIEEINAIVATLEANEETLFQVSLYAQVHGETRDELEARTRRVEGAFGAARAWARVAPPSRTRPAWRAPYPRRATGWAGAERSPARSSRPPTPSAPLRSAWTTACGTAASRRTTPRSSSIPTPSRTATAS